MHQLDDTLRVAAEFFKKNFKLKFENRNTKVIVWQHSFDNDIIYENIIYENMHVHFVENGS